MNRYFGWVDRVSGKKGYADLDTRFSSYNTKAEGTIIADGVADDRAAFDTLVNVTMQAVGGQLDVIGTIRIASNMTIPANVTLRFMEGASLSVDVGVTVTLAGQVAVSLPLRKIFGGLGSIALAAGSMGVVYPHWWGALGNGKVVAGVITGQDDWPAFKACRDAAISAGGPCTIKIPPLAATYFYRLTGAWVFTGANNVRVVGEGVRSLLCIHNAAGANCITMDASPHFELENFAITGVLGSGDGIQLINASHRGKIKDVLVQWVDGDGIRITSGISTRLIGCTWDQNNGYDLAALGGLRGNINNGLNVEYNALGYTTDTRCIGCTVEAGGGDAGGYGVKVGDAAAGRVDDFQWIGGMVEGLEKCIYLRCQDGVFDGTYIEPPAGVIANYVVTMDRCNNTVMQNGVIQGDVQLLGACSQSGFENIRGCGFDISSSSDACFIRNGQYGNIVTGPGGGQIKDRAPNTMIENMRNASNSRYAIGRSVLGPPMLYFGTNMEDWVVASGIPCGFDRVGGTITKETVTVRSGTNSMKDVYTADLTQDIRIRLQPINMFRGKWVTVEAWVYNLATGLATIGSAINNGAQAYWQGSYQANTWERMQVSFYVDPADNVFDLKFTGLIGTVYWDSIKIWVSDFTPINQMTLDGSATPEISYGGYGGYSVPTLLTSGVPVITNFLKPHVGKPFTIHFAGGTTIQANANCKLAGGANFVGTADDALTLIYRADGVFEEVSRSVNA